MIPYQKCLWLQYLSKLLKVMKLTSSSCWCYSFPWGRDSNPSGSFIVRSLALVRLCLGLFLFVSTFLSSLFLTTRITMILVSGSSSYFTLALPMREVSCVRNAPRACDPRYLSMLNCIFYFGLGMSSQLYASCMVIIFFVCVCVCVCIYIYIYV